MRKLFLATLLVFLPSITFGQSEDWTTPRFEISKLISALRDTGCTAPLSIMSENYNLQAGFLPTGVRVWWKGRTWAGPAIIITDGLMKAANHEQLLAVVYHEASHCLFNDNLYGSSMENESAADVYSASRLCNEGKDGIRIWRSLFRLFTEKGENTDSTHPIVASRLVHIMNTSTFPKPVIAP